MTNDWIFYVRSESYGGGVRFDLPARPLLGLKLMGIAMVVFDGLILVFLLDILWKVARPTVEDGAQPERIMQVVFISIMLLGSVVPILVGLWLGFGRSRVEWKDGQLFAVDILGPLKWVRRMPRKPICKLVVTPHTTGEGHRAKHIKEAFAVLQAEFAGGLKKTVLFGYPKEWLLGLAQELSRHIDTNPVVVALTPYGSVEEVVKDRLIEAIEKSPNRKVQVEEFATGLRLTVPPVGSGGIARQMQLMGVVGSVFAVVLTVIFAVSEMENNKSQWPGVAIGMALFIAFLAVLLQGINISRRTTVFTVDGGWLRVEVKGIFGFKQLEWRGDEIATIRVGPSGMTVNNTPLIELQVITLSGKKKGFLAGYDEAELYWMASRLRKALRLPNDEGI